MMRASALPWATDHGRIRLALGHLAGLFGFLLLLLDDKAGLLGLLLGDLFLLHRGGIFRREVDVAQDEIDQDQPVSPTVSSSYR